MRILIILLTLTLLLLMTGCSNNPTSSEPAPAPNLQTGELPAELSELVATNTPETLNPSPRDGGGWVNWPDWPDYEYLANSDVYAVTFLWGDFMAVPTPGITPTNWSGELSVNGEAIVIPRMPIAFEEGEDYIVDEDIPASAAWVSQTMFDFDGISFLVFVRRDIVYITPPTLTFDTEPISLNFDFEQLVKFQEFYLLDEGRALAVHSRKIWPPRCPGGFIEGNWIKDDIGGTSGSIEGVWMSSDGQPEGIVHGQFWTDPNGHREFSGWVTGYYLTYIIAEFKGSWWYDDPGMCITCGSSHGWMRGNFAYTDGSNRGGMIAAEIGNFASPDPNELILPLNGVWEEFCPFDYQDSGQDNRK